MRLGDAVDDGLGRRDHEGHGHSPYGGEGFDVHRIGRAEIAHADCHGSARYVRGRGLASEFPAAGGKSGQVGRWVSGGYGTVGPRWYGTIAA
ncbi:hypothetical protein SGFS_090000 [Streptomyces graminofaciens]|uniref:Uncharacterized protein n=1 Tax=Streptomyces graminofaciens TaxID=68212 RepID=A0ABM7FMB2_9ACTN|nr:hypothetical protein SGFS_090000 [Streptomyces graminofaciens]